MQILSKKPSVPLDDLVAQIVESETFRSAPMMRTLLLYLWKHQGEPISEYAVAIDALGRPSTFDPRTDSTVRVQISRLRAKLKEFYEAAGDSFPLRLTIPLGRHDLQWTYEQPQNRAQPRLEAIPRKYAIPAAVAFVALLIVCIALFIRVRALETSASATTPPLPRFWQSFLVSSKPVEIVIPSPVYFFWPDHGFNVRDLSVSEFSNWPSSPSLRELAAKWGPPTLSQNYVGAPEMNAGVRLLQFLQGRIAQIEIIESRKLAADSFATRNTIFIGMPRTAAYLEQISRKLNFYIERVEPDVILNLHPLAGETPEFREVDYSADRIRYPGIIALLPPRPERTRSLLLLGRSPVSIATMLSSVEGLRLLDEQWRKNGSPESWEMVVEADTYRGDTIARVWPVSFRPISTDFWK
ncbi:MAG TPA: helix-turn-helix domain-containing protein [Bryobacteraceae bacterium]|nr:helix-turn-helix domain-containing protein [Bryobacteraceae bacterium]